MVVNKQKGKFLCGHTGSCFALFRRLQAGEKPYLTGEAGALYTPKGLLLYFHFACIYISSFLTVFKPSDL